MNNELEELKKKTENTFILERTESFNLVPARHSYPLFYIMLFLKLVLNASVSLRGSATVLQIISETLHQSGPTPSYFSGRLWLLKLGYYKLTRPKELAQDWAWLVDCVAKTGDKEYFMISGIHLCHVPQNRCLKYEDIEPITLTPITHHATGEVIYQLLEETVPKTGIPREIIGDYGSILKCGIKKFCKVHPQTSYVHDIKHQTALILKHKLSCCSDWVQFTKLAASTKKEIQQTSLAYLAPPHQRSKSRYMNLEPLLKWAKKTLVFLDKQEVVDETHHRLLLDKLGWLFHYKASIQQWDQVFQSINMTENFIKKQGITSESEIELKKLLPPTSHLTLQNEVQTLLLNFVKQESFKAKPQERLVGSTEVLESVFGKQKSLEQEQEKIGFTHLVLGIAAQISITTERVVQAALSKVTTQDVLSWWKDTFGQSIQSQRKEALSIDTDRNKSGINSS